MIAITIMVSEDQLITEARADSNRLESTRTHRTRRRECVRRVRRVLCSVRREGAQRGSMQMNLSSTGQWGAEARLHCTSKSTSTSTSTSTRFMQRAKCLLAERNACAQPRKPKCAILRLLIARASRAEVAQRSAARAVILRRVCVNAPAPAPGDWGPKRRGAERGASVHCL